MHSGGRTVYASTNRQKFPISPQVVDYGIRTAIDIYCGKLFHLTTNVLKSITQGIALLASLIIARGWFPSAE